MRHSTASRKRRYVKGFIVKHLEVYGYITESNTMHITMLILMMISQNHLDTNKIS